MDWLSDAMALVQSKPMFNAILYEHGRNALGGSSGFANATAMMTAAYAKLQAKFPGVPIIGTSIPPQGVNNNTKCTTIVGQVPIDTPNTDVGGDFRTFHNWIMNGGGGYLAMAIDTAYACRDLTYFDRWGVDGFSATLVAPLTAASTNILRLTVAPIKGDTLVIEPDTASVDITNKVGIVTDVTQLADADWQVTLNGGRRGQANPSTAGLASRNVLAHAAGAVVKNSRSVDATHPTQRPQWGFRDTIITRKAGFKKLTANTANLPPELMKAPSINVQPVQGQAMIMTWGDYLFRPYGTTVRNIKKDGTIVASGTNTASPSYTLGASETGTFTLEEIVTNVAGSITVQSSNSFTV